MTAETIELLKERYRNDPNIPANCVNALAVAHQDKPLAQLNGDPSIILDALRTGESVPEIAQRLEISHQAIYEFLLKHCPDDWMSLQAARQLARLDDCEQVFDNENTDNIAVSRTREKTKLAQWHLERANRKLFGDNKINDLQVNVQINRIERVIVKKDETGVIQGEVGG